jgi:hypothetical protein
MNLVASTTNTVGLIATNATLTSATVTNLEVTNFAQNAIAKIAQIATTSTVNSLTFSTTTNILQSIVNGKISTTSLASLMTSTSTVGTTTSVISLRQVSATTTTIEQPSFATNHEMKFNISAGEKWIIQANINYSTNGTHDLALAISNSGSGATCSYGLVTNIVSDSVNACDSVLATGVSGSNNNTILTGVVTASGNGVVSLKFARNSGSGGDNVTISSGSSFVAYKVTGADLAEVYFAKDGTVEEGDVVALDGSGVSQVVKTSKKYQKNALGIISTKPGLVLGEADGTGKAVIVGLSGRVPVKVTDKNGVVKAGDFLTASDIPGVAMKATGAGQVIGQALTDDAGSGKVMVFIKNTYHDGTTDTDTEETIADKFTQIVKNTLEKLSNVALSMTLLVSEVKASIVGADTVKTNFLCVGSECFSEADMKEFRNFLNSKNVPVITEQSQEVPVIETPSEEVVAPATSTPEVTEKVNTEENAGIPATEAGGNTGSTSEPVVTETTPAI